MGNKYKNIKLNRGDRIIHRHRGKGTFLHYSYNHDNSWVVFDGDPDEYEVTTSLLNLDNKVAKR